MNPLQQQLDTGIQHLRAGRFDEAWALAEALKAQFPDQAEPYLFAADAARMRGDRSGAVAQLDALPEDVRGSAPVLLRKAQLQFNDSRRADALATVRQAMPAITEDEGQLRAVARILSDCQQAEEARAWLLDAYQRLPQSTAVLFDLAVTEFHLNLPDEAAAHLSTLLEREPYHPGALHLRSQLGVHSSEHNHIDSLRECLASGPEHPNLVTAANYALARELEDLERFEESFAALEAGAAAFRRTLQYDATEELASHALIRDGFSSDDFAALSAGYDDESPIFIVGLPRTGTTLVERLLNSHSQVVSIGEFRDFPMMLSDMAGAVAPSMPGASNAEIFRSVDFRALGERYLHAAREVAGDSPRFVDKLPYNFLYCGYILGALPKARILHLKRQPLDACYAIYKTLFFGAYSFSYDLDELTDYIISYHRQMEHWHGVAPGRIIDIQYETLVQEPESEARRILEACGLPWEEQVMDFHSQPAAAMTASAMQVRRPMHTDSIGTWQRAGDRFKRVQEKLAAAGLV
ncbi:MAG: sulfotransferase [Halieaceae bacterium]|nr:sulfotransferase [Halieaceae bacterium]